MLADGGRHRGRRLRLRRGAALFIFCKGAYADRSLDGPLLVLLDINMPRVGGVEVLQRIKQDPTRNKTPVIMLTTTDDPREIKRCYELGCSVYVTKPVAYEAFVDAIQRLGLFIQVVSVVGEEENQEALACS